MADTFTQPTSKQTLAFFGATGGVLSTSLALALKEGSDCTALVRNPEKLLGLLKTQHSVPEAAISSHLTVQTGNVKDASAVAKALISPTDAGHVVDAIVFGVGGAPKVQLSLLNPFTIDDPNICESGIKAIFQALEDLSARGIKGKPRLLAISSTGLHTAKTRDVPLGVNVIYRWLIAIPHADKERMEELIMQDVGKHLGGYVIVRGAAFTDGEPMGLAEGCVRVGWEWGQGKDQSGEEGREKEPGPQIGYTISRRDLGAWIFWKGVMEGEKWVGKCVSICY